MASTSEIAVSPSKLNDQIIETFARVISLGNYPIVACQIVGIHITTYRLWMRRGEDSTDPNSLHARFHKAVKEAEALSEGYAVEKWRKHMGTNYKASRDFLARRFSSRWGPTYKVTIEVEKELTRLMEKLAEKLDSDTYQLVIAALGSAQEDLGDEPLEEDDIISFVEGIDAIH